MEAELMKKISKIALYVVLSLVLILLVSVIWYIYGPKHDIHYNVCGKEVPISVPFEVSKKGETLSCDFVIEDKDYYTISLIYLRESGKKLPVSDELDEIGRNITLGYRLYGPDGKLIIPITSGVKSVVAHDARGSLATIMTTTYSPGKYRLEIKSLNDVHEIREIKTDILIAKSRAMK